jgi:4-amino-4-deoxy-L-arabinose transferase-like glycosyltransferase
MKINRSKISLLVISLIFIGLGTFQIVQNFDRDIINIWDEASSAKNAIDMLMNGNYLVQYDDGVPVRDDFKPPVSLWLKMISYKIFGINEFSVRFPSIVAALLTLLALWYFGFFILKKPELGMLFALLTSCTQGFIISHVARTGEPDSLVILFITLSLISYYLLLINYPVKATKYLFLFGCFVLLAILTKGIIGLVSLVGLAVFTLITPNGRKLILSYKFWLTIAIVVAISASYYIVREYIDPGYLEGVWKYEIFAAKKHPDWAVHKHPEFSFYFFHLATKGFYPFLYLLPLAIVTYFLTSDKTFKYLISYSFWGSTLLILLMSLSHTKNTWYISTVYPFLIILIGSGVYGFFLMLEKKVPHRFNTLYKTLFVVTFLLLCINPTIAIYKQNKAPIEVYNLHREGRFIKHCKETATNIKDFEVVITNNMRHAKFYAKKYKYEEGSNIILRSRINDSLVGKIVAICNNESLMVLHQKYKSEKILNDEYCVLLNVLRLKEDKDFDTLYYDTNLLNGKRTHFVSPKDTTIQFYNNGLLGNELLSGSRSVSTNTSNAFALSVNFTVKDKFVVSASAWRKKGSKGGLAVIHIPDINFYNQAETVVDSIAGWEKIENTVLLPSNYRNENIRAFLWNTTNTEIFFADFRIVTY